MLAGPPPQCVAGGSGSCTKAGREMEETSMAKLIVMYRTPKDPAAFDRYYFSTHVPLAKKIPGVMKYEVSDGPLATPAGSAPYHLVAVLEFRSMAEIETALTSPEGQAAAGDIPNFADGGAELFLFDTKEV